MAAATSHHGYLFGVKERHLPRSTVISFTSVDKYSGIVKTSFSPILCRLNFSSSHSLEHTYIDRFDNYFRQTELQ